MRNTYGVIQESLYHLNHVTDREIDERFKGDLTGPRANAAMMAFLARKNKKVEDSSNKNVDEKFEDKLSEDAEKCKNGELTGPICDKLAIQKGARKPDFCDHAKCADGFSWGGSNSEG